MIWAETYPAIPAYPANVLVIQRKQQKGPKQVFIQTDGDQLVNLRYVKSIRCERRNERGLEFMLHDENGEYTGRVTAASLADVNKKVIMALRGSR